jgi:tetratricopeptide (TPR) repeat protein
MRTTLAAALPALLLLAPPTGADDRWTEVQTPHFQLAGNASPRDMRRIGQRLEKFRAAVAQLFPAQPRDGAAPTTVLVLKNADALRPFFPVYAGKARPIGGIFVEGQDRNYMALDAQARDEAYQTVFHEYMHLLLSRTPYPIPAWMNEGLAELYSNALVHDKEVELGRPIASHVLLLRQRTLIPFETFFAVDQASPYYNEEDKRGIFYAQAWALAHYLLVEKGGQGRPLRTFLEAVAAGTPGAEACRLAFGVDPATLEKQLAVYVRQPSFRYFRSRVEPLLPAQVREAPLRPHEAEFLRGDALVHLNRLADGRPYLERAMRLEPGYAPAYRSLGLGFYYARDYEAAGGWFTKAVERDPQDGVARFLRANSFILAAGPAFGPAAAATVREDLRQAVEKMPAPGAAWQMLAFVDSVLGSTGPEAEQVLRQAIKFEPARRDLKERLARLLLARGGLDEALKVEGTRLAGRLVRMTCLKGRRLEFVMEAGPRRLRLRAAAKEDVMLYRQGALVRLDWECGPLNLPATAFYVPDGGDPDAGLALSFALDER